MLEMIEEKIGQEELVKEIKLGNCVRLRRTRVGVVEREHRRFLLLLITFKHRVGCLVSKTHQRVERRGVHLCKKRTI